MWNERHSVYRAEDGIKIYVDQARRVITAKTPAGENLTWPNGSTQLSLWFMNVDEPSLNQLFVLVGGLMHKRIVPARGDHSESSAYCYEFKRL